MAHDVEHLKREIEALEKQLSGQHFGGLFDRKRFEQIEDKLKKKRKDLARLQATDEHDDLEVGLDHVEIPEFIAGIEETPDMGPDFPLVLDADKPPTKSAATRAAVTPKSSPPKRIVKTASKAVKKRSSKSKPKAAPKKKDTKPTPKKKPKR